VSVVDEGAGGARGGTLRESYESSRAVNGPACVGPVTSRQAGRTPSQPY
jgi:hypothetical protein